MRFYEARGGKVAIDGHDVTSLDPAWLRSRLAFVQQEPVLFGVTVRENVAYALAAADARRARAGHQGLGGEKRRGNFSPSGVVGPCASHLMDGLIPSMMNCCHLGPCAPFGFRRSAPMV